MSKITVIQKATAPMEEAIESFVANLKPLPTEEIERRRRESLAVDLAQAKLRFAECGCPLRHRSLKDINRGGEWGQKFEKLTGRLGSGFLVGVVGVRGSGKTQMAVALVWEACKRGKSARFMTAMELFMEIKASYGKNGPSESDIIRKHATPSLLVIDEIEKRADNDWENRLLYELVNRRYNALKDTLLIGNQAVEDLKNALGESIASRMRETGGIMDCNWKSFRK